MPRKASLSNAFTKGVLDPALSERIDLSHYYNGLESALNIEVKPQGGFQRRAGSTLGNGVTAPQRLRRRLQPVAVTAAMITAANGGTIANLVDQAATSLFTTVAVAGTEFVLFEIDLGAAVDVVFVDLTAFSGSVGRFPKSLAVEWFDGTDWISFAPDADRARKTLSSGVRTRRFGEGPGVTRNAQRWRVVLYDAAGAGIVNIGGVRLWGEKRQVSACRALSFARTADLVYEMVLSDRNIDVFRDHAWQAAIPVNIDGRQVSEVNINQSLDTLLLYHEDVQTVQITRQGGNDEWNAAGAAFINVPVLSPGTAFSGDQDEVQEVRLPRMSSGAAFVLWLEDKVTNQITYAPATFAVDVAAALTAIGVPAGVVVDVLDEFDPGFRLTFDGGAGGRRWPLVFAVVLNSDKVDAKSIILQRGLDASGPIMGDTTGWPRCGTTFQERHLIGGFRAAPVTFGVSRFGDPFDFQDNLDPLTADLAFFGTLDTDQVETIHEIFAGRHIQIFTEAGEWYVETRTLDATQPPNVLLTTRYGLQSAVPVVFTEGSSLFIQRGGQVLRDMVFSDTNLSYNAEPLSLLAPHLLTDVTGIGYRPARSTDEGNQLFLVNGDGSLAFMTLLRAQEVVAMVPWKTDGRYRGAFGDVLFRMWLVVERETLTGGKDLYLEKVDGSHTLDAAVKYNGAPVSVMSGLGHLEGKDVWAWADGDLVGPMLVTSGQAILPAAASSIIAGLFPALRARLPHLREKLQNEKPWRPPARVYEVELALAGTGQIDLSVNGGPFRNVPLTFGDDKALDIAAQPPRDTTGIASSAPADQMERLIRAITMIPASGEFVYATDVITKTSGGLPFDENMHNTTDDPDFLVSLGQARQALPNLENISLFVSWFGSDLRAGSCTITPKIDRSSVGNSWAPYDWAVAGLTRATASLVSNDGGVPAYGGTPTDKSVVDAIKAIKDKGQAATLTPFLVMDVPAGNALANPYGGASQPAYPWRGRITCDPAPGQPATVDLTGAAATQVAAFVGTAAVADFSVVGETVVYSGPAEFSYRRFILHYAYLALAAGNVDVFVIGSEMPGISRVRDTLGHYPFVDALVQLAADVKTVLGANTKITYAADWTEFAPHQTGVPGEAYFHLDLLWSSVNIDAIGIDNYAPLADWRDGSSHLDYVSGFRSIYDHAYLQSHIEGGESYEWYYASQADRDAQIRSDITDGAYGKPWVWRAKDIKNWWLNQHYNRPGGVEDAGATAWVPQSKPIWFMELGCPAVDKGANQPNVFYDPKSSESARPHYSVGVVDEKMQRAFIEALIGYYLPGQSGFEAANNPISSVTGARMIDVTHLYIYTWDARFFPAFPEFVDVWSDGGLWETGHWITGRVYLSQAIDPDALPVGLSPELPLRDRLLTGNIRITNLRGWSRHPTIEVSQSKPAPLELRAIRYEVAHHG